MSLMKKLTSGIVASSLILGMVSTAFANYTPASATASAERMVALKIVNGTDKGLELSAAVTRAQFVTILARAWGQEETAKLLAGANTGFTDITASDAWAAGYIALAKNMAEKNGFKLGINAEGTLFAPKANLTAIEAVAFLMKFMGIKANDTLSWPQNYIQGAVDAGLITVGDKATLQAQGNAPATRGLAFYLADQAFYGYKMANGKTVYTSYLDTTPPVLTITVVPTTVAKSVKISGTVSGQSALYVGSPSNKVTPAADGKFEATVELKVGQNDIWVQATDLAGNVSTQTAKVTRNAGAAASIAATALTVAAGASVDFKPVVKDANGTELTGAALEVTAGTLGSYANGKFTAATTAGTGTITLKSGAASATVKVTVTAGAMATVAPAKASIAKGEFVAVQAKDAYGNAVSGASYTQTSADAMLDMNTGVFTASMSGSYTVTATKDGVSVTGTVGVYSSTATKLAVSAPEAMVGNDATAYDVSVSALDTNGNVVGSYDKDIALDGQFTAAPGTTLIKKAINGVATFKVVADDANRNADIDIDATSNNGTSDITGTTAVKVVAQVATTLKIAAPKYLTVNEGADSVSGSVYVLDQKGEPMVGSDSWTVTVSVTGAGYLTADKKTETTVIATGSDSSKNFSLYHVDATQVGAINITASFTGLQSATATTTAAYGLVASKLSILPVTTAPVKAAGEGVYKFKVERTDKNGVPIAVANALGFNLSLNLNTSKYGELKVAYGQDASVLTAANVNAGTALTGTTVTVNIPDGESYTYVAVVAAKFVGTISTWASATNYTSGTGTVAFKAGAADHVLFTREGNVDVLTSKPEVTLIAKIVDSSGNEVAEAGHKVRFSATSYDNVKFNGAAMAFDTTTDATGKAQVTTTILPYLSSYIVTVSHDIDADADYEDEVSLGLTMRAAVSNSISVQTWAGDDSGRKTAFGAGETFNIRAYVKDNNDLYISSADIEETLVLSGITLSTQATPGDVNDLAVVWTLVTDNGSPYYQATLKARKTGSFTLAVAETSVLSQVKTSRTINVSAGDFNQIVVSELNSSGGLAVESGKAKAFTVRVADKYGNLVGPTQVTGEIVFDIAFANKAATATSGTTYYDVRTALTSGSKTTGWTIGAGRNSATFYLVTNDVDFAQMTMTVTNTQDPDFKTGNAYDVTVKQ